MRRFIFSFSMMLFSLVGLTQAQLLDSIHVSSYEIEEWKLSTINVYDYIDPQKTIEYAYDLDSQGERKLIEVITLNYNDNGDIISNERKFLDGSTGLCESILLSESEYDQDFNLVRLSVVDINPETEDTVKRHAVEYNFYDDFGNYGERINYLGFANNIWEVQNVLSYIHYYSPEDLLDSTAYFRQGEFKGAAAYNYDGQQSLIESREYFGAEQTLHTRMQYVYDSDKLIEWNQELYSFDDFELEPTFRLKYFYDGTGVLDTELTESYNKGLCPVRKRQYFFSGIDSTVAVEINDLDIHWINKGGGNLYISIGGLDRKNEYDLGIFNMMGQKVKSLAFSNLANWDRGYLLESGTFVLVIRDQDGGVSSEKMMVVR